MGRFAGLVPDTWLDPLLTGPNAVPQRPCGCVDIEAVLTQLKERIAQAEASASEAKHECPNAYCCEGSSRFKGGGGQDA